ncbi:MAG: 50S ribosomal protein L17 [Patescibacteria group bacterium]
MRHHNTNRKFGRERNSRKALMRSLAIALLERGQIETTEAKAKELRPFVEKLITKGREDTLANRRHLLSVLGSGGAPAVQKIMEEYAKEYQDRPGGYLRVVKTRERIGSDGAQMATIEFVGK